MKYLRIKSKIINNFIFKEELKRKLYKSIFINVALSKYLRRRAFLLLSSLDKKSALSYFRSRCIYTNSSRGVLKFFKVSRVQFRHMASYGHLMGIRKASW